MSLPGCRRRTACRVDSYYTTVSPRPKSSVCPHADRRPRPMANFVPTTVLFYSIRCQVPCWLRSKPRTAAAHCVSSHCRRRTEWRTFSVMSHWPVSGQRYIRLTTVSRRPRVSACEPIKCWHATCPPCIPCRRWSNECCHRFPHNTQPLKTNSLLGHCAAMALNHISIPNPGTKHPNKNPSVPSEISLSALKIILLHVSRTLKQQRTDKTGSSECVPCYVNTRICSLWIFYY